MLLSNFLLDKSSVYDNITTDYPNHQIRASGCEGSWKVALQVQI